MTAFARVLPPARKLASGALFLVAFVWTAVAGAAPAPDSFADLAARLLPAVVNISTTQTIKGGGDDDQGGDLPQFPPGSPFDQFFKNFMQNQGQLDNTPRKVTALGSGFIIDPDGLVVTNYHVIEDSDDITVIMHDTKALKAKVLGFDKSADLALLKISAPEKLPYVKFGDSDAMRVGDWVIAIGNPFGLGGTVTAGIVSARSRNINDGPYDDFLQTDAAINKGNSGGPLINMNGDVIGINSAIYSPSGGSIGIGFSIPSNEASPIISDLQKYGKWRRGWIGVQIQSVTQDIADSLGLKSPSGALVANVTPGGPSDKAGIHQGDVITAFNGTPVTESRDLSMVVARTPVDSQATVTVWRDGQTVSIKATVGLFPDEAQLAALTPGARNRPAVPKPVEPSTITSLGMKLAQISPDLRKQYNIGGDTKGVVVTSVDPNGAAADQGVRPGDVITEISQQPVSSPTDITQKVDAARQAGHKTVLAFVQSGDSGSHFVSLRIDGKPSDQPDTDNGG